MTELDNLRVEKLGLDESSKVLEQKYQLELGQLKAEIESLQSQVSSGVNNSVERRGRKKPLFSPSHSASAMARLKNFMSLHRILACYWFLGT